MEWVQGQTVNISDIYISIDAINSTNNGEMNLTFSEEILKYYFLALSLSVILSWFVALTCMLYMYNTKL